MVRSAFCKNLTYRITGNVHIDYRCGDTTCGVVPAMAHCAAAMHFLSLALPENAIYLAGTGRAGPYLYGSNAVSCAGQCRRGVNTRIDSLKDFHLQWKIEYKSGFIGNNYKKVIYLVRKYMVHRLTA